MNSVKDSHSKANISAPGAAPSASAAENASPAGAQPPRTPKPGMAGTSDGLTASLSAGEEGSGVRCVGPQLAVRSDGSLLVSLEDIPPDADLGGRPVWSGLVLTPRDAHLVLDKLAHADADVASRFIMRLPRKRGKK